MTVIVLRREKKGWRQPRPTRFQRCTYGTRLVLLGPMHVDVDDVRVYNTNTIAVAPHTYSESALTLAQGRVYRLVDVKITTLCFGGRKAAELGGARGRLRRASILRR